MVLRHVLGKTCPVWFDTKYRLKFSYLFTEEELGNARLYVEVIEWDIFKEGWKRVRKEFQPIVSNTWMQQEYEFEVSGTAPGDFCHIWVIEQSGYSIDR